MAEIVAEGADIRYGHVVSSVRWGSEGVHLTCSNGQSFHADAVIVTVSLGVLKASPCRNPLQSMCMGKHTRGYRMCMGVLGGPKEGSA